MKDELPSPKEMARLFTHVAKRMVESKDELTQADKAIGDGDHGIGMARGWDAVGQKLEGEDFQSMDEVFKAVGMALMGNVGGASGAIFGTLFRVGGKNLDDNDYFDTEALVIFLNEGLAAVQARGKAKVGDKTLVDALAPAAEAAKANPQASLAEAMEKVVEAARQGMESTKDMVATLGRARTLGERAKGHADPGAISMYLTLKFMHEFI